LPVEQGGRRCPLGGEVGSGLSIVPGKGCLERLVMLPPHHLG